jgi:hypothetical protein
VRESAQLLRRAVQLSGRSRTLADHQKSIFRVLPLDASLSNTRLTEYVVSGREPQGVNTAPSVRPIRWQAVVQSNARVRINLIRRAILAF